MNEWMNVNNHNNNETVIMRKPPAQNRARYAPQTPKPNHIHAERPQVENDNNNGYKHFK